MISIVIPVFNEEKSITETVNKIYNLMKSKKSVFEIILVDDGSTDGSLKVMEKLTNKKEVTIVKHDYNIGYGASLKTGIKHSNGDIIVIDDADSSYDANDIPKLLSELKNYDMVVGARTMKGAAIPFFRKPAKLFLKILSEYLTNRKIPDLNSGLRAFRKKDFLPFKHILSNTFSFTTTITIAYLSSDLSIKYVPINYFQRKGKSKISPVKDFLNFNLLIVRAIAYFNPIKIFMPVAALLFTFAIILVIYSIITNDVKEMSISILVVTSMQIALFGILNDIIVKSRNK